MLLVLDNLHLWPQSGHLLVCGIYHSFLTHSAYLAKCKFVLLLGKRAKHGRVFQCVKKGRRRKKKNPQQHPTSRVCACLSYADRDMTSNLNVLFWCSYDVTSHARAHIHTHTSQVACRKTRKLCGEVFETWGASSRRECSYCPTVWRWRAFTLHGNGSVEATFSMARFLMLGVRGPRHVGQQLSFCRHGLHTR